MKEKKCCKNCSKEISLFQTYCNKICYEQYKEKLTDKAFLEGLLRTNNTIRKALTRLKGDICAICNSVSSIWNGRNLCLQVDHIDGDSDNNKADNLRLVCPNCHSQLETTKSRIKKENNRNKYLRKYKGY